MCLGIPGKVTEVYRENDVLMGKVEFGGVAKRICLEYMPDIAVGEYALVHVGFAISRIDEEEARQVFAFLEGMGKLSEVRQPDQESGVRSQESGVRSQESGVRNQEPGVRKKGLTPDP